MRWAQKNPMNDVRGQEMSENTLLFFAFFENRFFAICGKGKGVVKNEPLWKCAQSPGGPTLWKKIPIEAGGTFTLIFWKNLFFGIFSKKIFNSRYLVSVDTKIWIPNWEWQHFQTKWDVLCRRELLNYFLFWLFDSLRNQKCETHIFLEKRLRKFSKFREQNCYIVEFKLSNLYSEKNKIWVKFKNKFFADFFLFYLFIFF